MHEICLRLFSLLALNFNGDAIGVRTHYMGIVWFVEIMVSVSFVQKCEFYANKGSFEEKKGAHISKIEMNFETKVLTNHTGTAKR